MRNIRSCWRAMRRIRLITTMLLTDPTEEGSAPGAISNRPGATSSWCVWPGCPEAPQRHPRPIMKARCARAIEPKDWSSSSWPLGEGAPNRVRLVSTRSGRCSARRASTRRDSAGADVGGHRVAVASSNQRRMRRRGGLPERLLRAQQGDSCRPAPTVYETKVVGMVMVMLLGPTCRTRGGSGPKWRSHAPRRRPGCRPTGRSWRRGSPCTRPARELGQRAASLVGFRTSWCFWRWSRSWARTSACSGRRHAPSPTSSRHARRHRRWPGRRARGPRWCAAASCRWARRDTRAARPHRTGILAVDGLAGILERVPRGGDLGERSQRWPCDVAVRTSALVACFLGDGGTCAWRVPACRSRDAGSALKPGNGRVRGAVDRLAGCTSVPGSGSASEFLGDGSGRRR